MKYCKAYLKDRLKLLAAVPVLGAIAAFLFYLYDLPSGPLLYTGLVCGVCSLIFFVLPDFISYVRRAKLFEELGTNLNIAPEASPSSSTLPEKLLFDGIRSLVRRTHELEALHEEKQQDLLNYYTLWVHQVKTPLSALRLILQSSRQEGTLLEETLDALAQELFKVERYVEMVLGYLRLDTMSSDLRLEPCDLHALVSQALKKFAPQFIYQKLSLDFHDFTNRVITDEKWLLFVLEQLFSNALKYTKQGSITIFMDQNDVLYIRDTGIGIQPEDLPRIFERGFTGRNGRVEKTSSGLGLYLVKQVLDRLLNRIEIESEPGKGTEVRLYLHRTALNVY